MRKNKVLLINLIIAFLFAFLFYGNYIGMNLLLFELIAVPIIFTINKPVKLNFLSFSLLFSVFISAIMVVLLNTNWSIFINIVLLFVFSTTLSFKGFRSFIHAFLESFLRAIISQFSIFQTWKDEKIVSSKTSTSNFGIRKIVYLIIVPLLILIGFIILYASASSLFYQKFDGVFTVVFDFFKGLNFLFVLMVILGLMIGNSLFMRTSPIGVYENDIKAFDNLIRTRVKRYSTFKFTALKLQNLSGIVLLVMLNLLILYFNILDVTHIWFGFEWDGSPLKEFVHEGTWVLVFSIFLSAVIALYFFRGNLNFYSKNKNLKILTIAWLTQNMVMAVSVMIRNYWYINYFGLAYKRIAVLFFLLLTIVGLITIIIKILNKKTSFFLWRTNSYVLLLVLLISICVNWDVKIAKFNFDNYERSLLDYRFLSKLNSTALPYTIKTVEELEEIDYIQTKVVPEQIKENKYLWDIYRYSIEVDYQKERFLKRYSHTNFFEWNLADYSTYKSLRKMGVVNE
jgi:hypothetical protein